MTLFNSNPYFKLPLLKYLILLLFVTSFCGCTTTLKTVNMSPADQPYKKIVVMVINTRNELRDFSKPAYDSVVNPLFNNLKDLDVRTRLEEKFANRLSSLETTVVRSSDLFKLHENVSYTDYLNKLKTNDVEAILIVGLSTHWGASRQTGHHDITTAESDPSFAFLYYLVDLRSLNQVWLGTDKADYRVNNIAVGAVSNALFREGFIYKPGIVASTTR